MASQTKRPSRDNNGDGLVDESKRIRLATEQGSLTLRNRKVESYPVSTKRWEVEKAVADGPGFKVLLKGHGPRRRQFKVLIGDSALFESEPTISLLSGNQSLGDWMMPMRKSPMDPRLLILPLMRMETL